MGREEVGSRGDETMFDLFSSYSFAPSYEGKYSPKLNLARKIRREERIRSIYIHIYI